MRLGIRVLCIAMLLLGRAELVRQHRPRFHARQRTGHGRYEQNLPRDLLGQPVAEARSMAIHESPSLAYEMQLASHPGFVARLAPLISEAFGVQPAFEPGNLQRLLTRLSQLTVAFLQIDPDCARKCLIRIGPVGRNACSEDFGRCGR